MKEARLNISYPAVLCLLGITEILVVIAAVTYQRQVQAAAQDLDTPVVLIGGSMTFKRGLKDNNNLWQPVTPGQEYHAVSSAAVAAIVIKAMAVADPDTDISHHGYDGDPTTDKPGTSPILTGGNSWRITAFAIDSASPTASPAVLIASTNGTDIHVSRLDPSARLCAIPNDRNSRRIKYGRNANCTNPETFTQVVVDVTGQPQQIISCSAPTSANAGPTRGRCRIVLRVQ